MIINHLENRMVALPFGELEIKVKGFDRASPKQLPMRHRQQADPDRGRGPDNL